jgi:hypothetical protein
MQENSDEGRWDLSLLQMWYLACNCAASFRMPFDVDVDNVDTSIVDLCKARRPCQVGLTAVLGYRGMLIVYHFDSSFLAWPDISPGRTCLVLVLALPDD